jgi:hypothetical protein
VLHSVDGQNAFVLPSGFVVMMLFVVVMSAGAVLAVVMMLLVVMTTAAGRLLLLLKVEVFQLGVALYGFVAHNDTTFLFCDNI